jgi:hypothetical protein
MAPPLLGSLLDWPIRIDNPLPGGSSLQNITTQVVRSGVWNYSRRFIMSAINLRGMAILARKRTSAAFGLVALA